MTTCFVIGFLATQASGAAGSPTEPLALSPQARELTASPRVAPEKCSARRAVRYYSRRINKWRGKMGTRVLEPRAIADHRLARCPHYLAHLLKRKSRITRLAYLKWNRDQYSWWLWLPDKFARVGACETGYGRKPGSWTWDSGTYVSFAGIIRGGFNQFAGYVGVHGWPDKKHPGPIPTPREQYEVAAAIQARFGWGAWGCGGA